MRVSTTGAPRIVSLVPSLTELLCELGCADLLVGRTGYCIHPAKLVAKIPKIGGTKTVNIEKIRRLKPTHLIVNIDENEKPTVELLRAFIPEIVVTHPIEVEDNFELYRRFGTLFDCAAAAEGLCTRLEVQMRHIDATNHRRRRVLYLIWKDPWMTISADTYVARMLARAGLDTVSVPNATVRYPSFEWSQLALADGDAVLLSTEPYRFDNAHVQALQAMPELAHCAVHLIDGEMTSWYGSRAIAGLEYLNRFRSELLIGDASGQRR